MSRKIVIASAVKNKAERIESSATTWGELKNEGAVANLLTDGIEAVVKPGNITLRGDDSALPEGDFNFFLIPSKNKSGWAGDYEDSDFGELENAIVVAIREAAAKIVAAINSSSFSSSTEDDEELANALAEAQDME